MQAGVFTEAILDQAEWKEFFKPVIILDCIHFQLSKVFLYTNYTTCLYQLKTISSLGF